MVAIGVVNDDLNENMAKAHDEYQSLRNELDRKNKQLEAQAQEIAGYRTRIDDLEKLNTLCVQEKAELSGKLHIVNQKVAKLDPIVDQLEQRNQNLQMEKAKVDMELVERNERIKHMQILAQESADTIRAKEKLIMEWKNMAMQLQTINQQLNQELANHQNAKIKMNLTETEQKHEQVNDQLKTLKLTHDEKMREWGSKYLKLQQEHVNQEVKLNAFKNNNMVAEIFELYKLLQDIKIRVQKVSGVVSLQINSERRTSMQERMKEFCIDYRRMASYLEKHNVDFSRFDLTSLDKCVRLHQGLNDTLKNRLDKIHTIDKETQSVWNGMKMIIYKIIDTQRILFRQYLTEIDEIETTPITEELAEIESLYEEAVGTHGRNERR